MGIDPAKPTPLYQQISKDIRRQITSGEMPVGTKLKPHRELAGVYGVSLITVKKALAGLVEEGLLHSHVGKGTFVARRRTSVDPLGRKLIGFVLKDLSSPYFSLISRAAEQKAEKEGYTILFSTSFDRLDKEDEQINRFRTLGVDALIIASMSRTCLATEAVRKLHAEGFPYVVVSYVHDPDIYYVGIDHEEAGYLATEHLIRLGYERIGYLNQGSLVGELRKQGYCRALRQYGRPIQAAFEFQYPYLEEWNDYRSGYEVGQRFRVLKERPEAVVVYNDLGALGFRDALLKNGVQVPRDIAIVGVDDIEQSRRTQVPLSTVRQPTSRIGALAVETVMQRIQGRPVGIRTILSSQLIARVSCGAPLRRCPRPDSMLEPT